MPIHPLTHDDLPRASALCLEAFMMAVAPSLSSVPAYERYGFVLAGDVSEFAGLVYQPMEKRLCGYPAEGIGS